MKIKIEDHKRRILWDKLREIFVLFLFCAILAVAAFGQGRIYEYSRHKDLREKYYEIHRRVMTIDGRLTVVEGPQKMTRGHGDTEIRRK